MDYKKKLTLEGLQHYHSKIKTLFTNANQSISNETSRATAKETEISAREISLKKERDQNNLERLYIEKTIKEVLPKEFQTSEFLLEKGYIDNIVERKDMKSTLSKLLRLHNYR